MKQCIDDGDISCQFPRNIEDFHISNESVQRPETKFDFFLCITRYARICSKVKRRLYSATSLTQLPSTLLDIIEELDHDVTVWCETVPRELRLELPISMSQLPRGRQFIQAVVLHSCYKYLVCSIHSRITTQFLWSRNIEGQPSPQLTSSDMSKLGRSADA
jgi:hypothetical protein